MSISPMYFAVRERVVGTVAMCSDDQLALPVPACPAWSVHELFAHLVSMPVAILEGDVPAEVMGGGDPNPWLNRLVEEHARRPVVELARRWAGNDVALAAVVDGAGLLLADIFTHEGDLHGAIGSRANRSTPELDSQIDAALAGLQKDIGAAGLPPLAVDNGHEVRVSAAGDAGWTLRTDFWTAHRALNSRRTREELRAIDHEGDPEPYLDVMHRHLPLPEVSLGE